MSDTATGRISQIIGPVIDVSFEEEANLPNIYDALEIKRQDGSVLVVECQQHIGENTVRCIAMDTTDNPSLEEFLSDTYTQMAVLNEIELKGIHDRRKIIIIP